jgi:hypothetical protein
MRFKTGPVVSKETVAVASEDVGGIFAYFDDRALAARVIAELNAANTREPVGEPRYFVVDMGDDNWDDFYFSFASDELDALVDADTGVRVGYALKRNAEVQQLICAPIGRLT